MSETNERLELRVQDVVQLHALFIPSGGVWVHTHGLVKYGYPELEVWGIPGFMAEDAAVLLNRVGQYMLESKSIIHADENMQLDDRIIRFVEDPLGVAEDHYEVERFRLIDPPGIEKCDCCEAKEASKH